MSSCLSIKRESLAKLVEHNRQSIEYLSTIFDNVPEYQIYLFEYAYREAHFLQLRQYCSSDEQFHKVIGGLASVRTTEGLLSILKQLEVNKLKEGQEFRLIIPTYHSIEGTLHQMYYPKKAVKQLPAHGTKKSH